LTNTFAVYSTHTIAYYINSIQFNYSNVLCCTILNIENIE